MTHPILPYAYSETAMSRLLRIGIFISLAVPWVVGCSGPLDTNADRYQRSADPLEASTSALVSGSAGTSEVCTAIAPPSHARLPHVTATEEKAAMIVKALEAILAVQTPPLPIHPEKRYSLPAVVCRDVYAQGYDCWLQIRNGEHRIQEISVRTSSDLPTDLANALFEALADSGAEACDDFSHQNRIALLNVHLSANKVQYDDASTYQTVPAPNVVVRGKDAKNLLRAIAEAGISDCDPKRKLFLVCNNFSGAPGCSVSWKDLKQVGSSELVYACGPASDPTTWERELSDSASLAIWKSILTGATKAGYQPSQGTIDQTTVINAVWFSWDGSKLGLTLVTSNETPPDGPQ